MTARNSISHKEAVDLLPWLVNDSLDTGERDIVREHASSCVICRRELAELEILRESVVQTSESAAIPAPDMRRINARIDAWSETKGRGRRFLASLREFGRSPWRLAFAAQTVLLLAVVSVLLWPAQRDAGFTTLTVPDELPDGHYVRVVFTPDLGADELGELLDSMSLTIVAGPSERGVFTLGFAKPVSADIRDAAVAALLNDPGVLFAQPVTPGGAR